MVSARGSVLAAAQFPVPAERAHVQLELAAVTLGVVGVARRIEVAAAAGRARVRARLRFWVGSASGVVITAQTSASARRELVAARLASVRGRGRVGTLASFSYRHHQATVIAMASADALG